MINNSNKRKIAIIGLGIAITIIITLCIIEAFEVYAINNITASTTVGAATIVTPEMVREFEDERGVLFEIETEKAEIEAESEAEKMSTRPEYNIILPEEYQEFLWSKCNEYNLSYTLALAIIWRESRMDAEAVNHNTNGTYDTGLFQINSNTMYALSEDLEMENFKPKNPYQNIEVGIYYISILRNSFIDNYSEENTFSAVCMGFHRGGNKAESLINRNGISIANNSTYVLKILECKEQLERYGEFT